VAIYRKIHTSFWGDAFIQELTPEQKYFFLYLLTNEKTQQCGIYEITKRQICYDTGYNIDTVNKLLKFFSESGKIKYSDKTSEIALVNWLKYNSYNSSTVEVLVNQQLAKVKDIALVQYLYGIDTQDTITRTRTGTREGEQSDEQEQIIQEEINIDFYIFWDLYDKKIGSIDKLKKKWASLKNIEREAIIEYIPKYKSVQPIKQYRKNPETFFNNKSWNDELVSLPPKPMNNKFPHTIPTQSPSSFKNADEILKKYEK